MCPRFYFKLDEKHMDFETFKKIVDRIFGVKEIALIGYGEPLLNPDFFKCVYYAKNKGLKVSTVSNGYLLKSRELFNNLLESDIDCIRFSIETIKNEDVGGHVGSEEVVNLIAKFKKVLIERNKTTKIIINTVVHEGTYNTIIPIIKWAEEANLDQVDVAHFNKLGFALQSNLTIEKELDLYKRIKQANFKIPVMTLQDRYLGLRKVAFRLMKKCPMAYDNVHITLDGGISPCICGFPQISYGNIFQSNLKEIWNSKKFRAFRNNQEHICAKCTLFKLYK
jgi:MoaA/NifB/PqqE/SkfB family radical SAM enzyme